MISDEGPRRDIRVFFALVVLFSVFHYLHDLIKIMAQSPFADFAHYYTYATAVARGIDPFDSQAIANLDAALTMRRAGGGAGVVGATMRSRVSSRAALHRKAV